MIVLSIGNSNLRWARFRDGAIVERGAIALGEVVRALGDTLVGGETVVVASVRPDHLETLLGWLGSRGIEAAVLGREFRVDLPNRYHRPREIGVDRLLASLEARAMFPGEGIAVIDLGTALTLNVVSPDGEFLGGLIAAGASTTVRALGRETPELPEVQPGPGEFLARSTVEAVSRGLHWQIVGGIERLLEGARDEVDFPLRVIATGGDAEALAPSIPAIERIEPDLVLRGLRRAYLDSRGDAP